ncbi:hypothetical protein K439DRAFT_1613138 [Ramaria rubella]|nr:hypothetical protein K439DRAFT_1613138 [Ramaria rubella]
MANGSVAPNWQLLRKSPQGKVKNSKLISYSKGKDIKFEDLVFFALPLQAYKLFNKPIFVALLPGNLDLTFPSSGNEESGSELSSTITDARMTPVDESKADTSDNETLPLAHLRPLFAHAASKKLSSGSPEVDHGIVYSHIPAMLCVFEHIAYATKENEKLWPFETTEPYCGLVVASRMLSHLITQHHEGKMDWPFKDLLQFFQMHLIPNLQFILQLQSLLPIDNSQTESEVVFKVQFRLSLHGIGSTLAWFCEFNSLIVAKPAILCLEDQELLVAVLSPYADALHGLMLHLRHTYDHLDRQTVQGLKAATAEDDLANLGLDLYTDKLEAFHSVLADQFGFKPLGDSTPCLDPAKILTGHYGLKRLMDDYIYPFFDEFPFNHSSYFSLKFIFF